MDDKAPVNHLIIFYNLVRASGGLFELSGVKASQGIDVVKFERTYAVGPRIDAPLPLGGYDPYGRSIRGLNHPSSLSGTAIKDRLLADGVMTAPGQQRYALNIARGWDYILLSVIILIPVNLSLVITIVWPIVATLHYKADAQVNIQTGFTIGSYVVTAGALLIALVAFLDNKFNATRGVPDSINNTNSASQTLENSSSVPNSTAPPLEATPTEPNSRQSTLPQPIQSQPASPQAPPSPNTVSATYAVSGASLV